jgi:hypothetical protein
VLDAVLVGAFAWTLIWLYQPLLARAGVPRVWFGAVHATLCIAQIGVLRSIGRLTPLAGGRASLAARGAHRRGPRDPGLAAAAAAAATFRSSSSRWRRPHADADRLGRARGARRAHGRATLLSTVSMLRTLAICVVNPIAGVLADRSLGWTMLAARPRDPHGRRLSPLRERDLAA